jgi:putative endonuclease
MAEYFVYILASGRHGTLYIGVTNDLSRRLAEHRAGTAGAFTKKYRVHRLVHAEVFETAYQAIAREKQLKKWNRDWKIRLIEENNLDWRDRNRIACLIGCGVWVPAFAGTTGELPVWVSAFAGTMG